LQSQSCSVTGPYLDAQRDLLFYAEALNDIESVRMAQDNRIRSLLAETGSDVVPVEYQAIRAHLDDTEKGLIKALEKAMKRHPLGSFVASTPGVGFKQAARFLAAVDDPCWNGAEGRMRRDHSELWKYLGLAPGQRKKRGERAAWNHEGKMRSFLIAESCIKVTGNHRGGIGNAKRSPYRDVYETSKARLDDAVHNELCVRCGPSGKPALAGSLLSDGHKHARALRKVQKAFIKDVFNERKKSFDAV